MPTSAIHSAQRFGFPILCNSGNSTTSAGVLMARLAFNFGLQTATMSSSIRYCEIVPGQCIAPWNTAASNGSSAEFDRRLPRRDMDHDFRIHPLEIRQTGNQPARREGRQRDEIQGRAVGKRRHALRRVGKVVQCLLHLRQIHLAGVGQYDALAYALEQANAEMDFELANLPADRALGQIELAGGAREAAVLSGHDKRRQFADRRNLTPFQRTHTPDVTPTSYALVRNVTLPGGCNPPFSQNGTRNFRP